jgi:hypothetical protein
MSLGLQDLILRWGGAPERVKQILRPAAVLGEEDGIPAGTGRVVRDGTWPGIRRPGNRAAQEAEVASASAEPWVDANGYLVEYFRALTPERRVWMAQRPPLREDVLIPAGTVELALAEARLAGGNFVVELPVAWRRQLEAGEAMAYQALEKLAGMDQWLKAQAEWCGLAALPRVTAWVEPGAATREVANLLHRRGACPALKRVGDAVPAGAVGLVAAGLKTVPAELLAAASRGAVLVVDQPLNAAARKLKEEVDRDFFAWGQGEVVVYRKRVADPSEFALDVIDLVGHKRRAARVWNAPAVLYMATTGRRTDEAALRLLNYGESRREDVQARIQGHYSKAWLKRPEGADVELPVARRGEMSEVFVPDLGRAAIVQFSK